MWDRIIPNTDTFHTVKLRVTLKTPQKAPRQDKQTLTKFMRSKPEPINAEIFNHAFVT